MESVSLMELLPGLHGVEKSTIITGRDMCLMYRRSTPTFPRFLKDSLMQKCLPVVNDNYVHQTLLIIMSMLLVING